MARMTRVAHLGTPSRRRGSLALLAGAIALVLSAFASPARATPAVTLHASLRPEKLGASTNISVGFRVATSPGQQPAQLRSFALQLPPGMGFVSSTLGVATCSEQLLLAAGAGACPRESLMGSGEVLVQAPFGPDGVNETAPASIFMTSAINGHTTMLFYIDATSPVIAALVFQTAILTPEGSSFSVLSGEVPQIATAPGSADLVIDDMQVNIGPRDILYYKQVHGHTVAYHPTGLHIPERCPRGGFVFGGSFGFQDGSRVRSSTAVACPRR
jgi:hypothetical protein